MNARTIAVNTIRELRRKAEDSAISTEQRAGSLYADAEAATASAAFHRAQVGEYSSILRQLDPDHAADYPDRQPTTPAIVSELRALADLLAGVGVPPATGGTYLELSCHGVHDVDARQLAKQVTAWDPDRIEVTERERYIGIQRPGDGPEFRLSLYLRPPVADTGEDNVETITDRAAIKEHQGLVAAADADEARGREIDAAVESTGHLPGSEPLEEQPAEPFVQASPAEVADAYAGSARNHAALIRRPGMTWRELYGAAIELGQRVRVHPSVGSGRDPQDFPVEYQGREGVVTKVEDDIPIENNDMPIEVLLAGETEPQCFAIPEVTILLPFPGDDDKPLLGGKTQTVGGRIGGLTVTAGGQL